MHILIIPSEEYIPYKNSLDGVFQRDQAIILKSKGHKIGIISVSMKYSLFMLLKGLFFKILQKKTKNNLNKKTISYILKTFVKKTFFLKKYISKRKLDNIPIYDIESYYGIFLSEKFICKGWIKGGLLAFEKYVASYGIPEIIHAHNMAYAGLLAVVLKKKHNIPIVVTEHSSAYSQGLISPYVLNKINNSLKNIEKFCVVSHSLGEIIKNKLPNLKKYNFIPNVLDAAFITVPVENKKSGNTFTFINIASFIPIKGQLKLIKAFALKFKYNKNVKLQIIGGGELENDLIKLIKSENIEKQVTIIGQLPRPQIIKHLDMSNAFVLSSVSETFGVVIIEALARGVPVVSTKCGGPESIIDKDNGVLVNDTFEDIGKGMQYLKNNILKYNNEKIRTDCINKYNGESFYKNILNCYKKI